MTKKCIECLEEKAFADFGKAKRNVDGLNNRCKSCYYTIRRKWYEAKQDHHKAKVAERRKKLLPELHLWMASYLKEHPCVDCGNDDILVLEFDHIEDNKEHNVGTLLKNYLNLEKVKNEVAKCEVRCVNCHRKITNKRRIENKVQVND
jgi:hypothetical protein